MLGLLVTALVLGLIFYVLSEGTFLPDRRKRVRYCDDPVCMCGKMHFVYTSSDNKVLQDKNGGYWLHWNGELLKTANWGRVSELEKEIFGRRQEHHPEPYGPPTWWASQARDADPGQITEAELPEKDAYCPASCPGYKLYGAHLKTQHDEARERWKRRPDELEAEVRLEPETYSIWNRNGSVTREKTLLPGRVLVLSDDDLELIGPEDLPGLYDQALDKGITIRHVSSCPQKNCGVAMPHGHTQGDTALRAAGTEEKPCFCGYRSECPIWCGSGECHTEPGTEEKPPVFSCPRDCPIAAPHGHGINGRG